MIRVQRLSFLLGVVVLLAAYLHTGVLNAVTLPASAWLVVPTMAAMFVGYRVHDRLDQERFRKVTLAVLVLTGLNLLRRAPFMACILRAACYGAAWARRALHGGRRGHARLRRHRRAARRWVARWPPLWPAAAVAVRSVGMRGHRTCSGRSVGCRCIRGWRERLARGRHFPEGAVIAVEGETCPRPVAGLPAGAGPIRPRRRC